MNEWPRSPADHTLVALAPCLAVATLVHGPGVARTALVVAIACGAILWLLRQQPTAPHSLPSSGLAIASLLIAFALPPATPLALCAIAGVLLGLIRWANSTEAARPAPIPANPAMLVVALLLVVAAPWLPAWPPSPLPFDAWLPQLLGHGIDASTGATALVGLAHRAPSTIVEWRMATGQLGLVGPAGSEWLAASWAVAGGYLVWRRVLSLAPIFACCGGVLLTAGLLYRGDGSTGGLPPLLHLFGGSTLLIATVVLAEPRSAPRNAVARTCLAALVGILLVLAREFGGGVDRAAAIVLLAGLATPWLDAHIASRRALPA